MIRGRSQSTTSAAITRQSIRLTTRPNLRHVRRTGMLFNSHLFLLGFLPAAILLYQLAGRSQQARILVLLALSLVFYGWWDIRFVPFLLGSILLNWAAARLFAMNRRRAVVTAAIVLDLAILGLFKYADFFAGSAAFLAGADVSPLGFVLPLGISFFTFHHIMYLADLRRGRAPLVTLDRYALYICFFPQAIAGPLSRWAEVGAQFGQRLAAPGWERRAALAATYVTLGLVQKVVLGDPLGQLLDPVYAAAQNSPGNGVVPDGAAWLAPFFIFEVFFDFAGYSNIAIGLALLFGVELPVNFDAPFRARSILGFWQRWHMTLGRFLRDYVFLRLADLRVAGWRHTMPQYALAIMATMGLCGLWHGAGWTFVIWGLLQGAAMLAALGWRRRFPALPAVVGWAATILFCMLTSVLFRAGSLHAAWTLFAALPVLPGIELVRQSWLAGAAAALAVALPAARVLCPRIVDLPTVLAPAVLGLVGLLILIQLGGTESYDFIYFQF